MRVKETGARSERGKLQYRVFFLPLLQITRFSFVSCSQRPFFGLCTCRGDFISLVLIDHGKDLEQVFTSKSLRG